MIKINVRDYGTMSFQLDYINAKNTCANFVKLARSGFYDGLTFHRVIKGFMIQGGDGETKNHFLDYTIKGDFSANGVKNQLKHERGVISMARTTVNDSASSQFFIMHKTTNYLDGQYAAFGKMTEGEDVLDKIASVKTDESDDSPLAPVIIDKVEVIDEPDLPIIKIQRPY